MRKLVPGSGTRNYFVNEVKRLQQTEIRSYAEAQLK